MKKYFTITVFIKWNINEGFRKNEYKYLTQKDRENGYKRICGDCARLVSCGTIVDYQIEVNK